MGQSRITEVFMDIQRGLPRQGPGNDAATRRALSYCKQLPKRPHVLDIGCGPGQQTLVLADELNAHVTAVDIHCEYLDELKHRSQESVLEEQITPQLEDMATLPYESECFDLVWAEGSAYIMGVENALRDWKVFIRPRGYLVLSELLWLSESPHHEVAMYFAQEYPKMTDIKGNLELFTKEGYRVIEHFTLPAEAWWDHYYAPLEAKLPSLFEKYDRDKKALELVQATESEINMRRAYADSYGYEFFIARKST